MCDAGEGGDADIGDAVGEVEEDETQEEEDNEADEELFGAAFLDAADGDYQDGVYDVNNTKTSSTHIRRGGRASSASLF